MTAGDIAAMYGQQSMWGSKKSDGEWGRLIFIFLGVEIISITCGLDEKGMVNGACKMWMSIIPGVARMQELRM